MQRFFQNKKLKIAIAAEAAAIVIFALFTLLAPKSEATVTAAQLQAFSGNVQDGARVIDDSFLYLGDFTQTPQLTLPRGSYTIELDYSCNHAWNLMHIDAQGEGTVWFDKEITLPQTTSGIYSRVWVWGEQARLAVSTEYRVGRLEVREVRVRENNDMALLVIYTMAAFFTAADILAWKFSRGSLRAEYKERRVVFTVITAAVLLSSLGIFLKGLYLGHDIQFHMLRLEGLKEALISGAGFPVRMRSYELFGYGYATSLTYPELLLYPYTLLRLMRIPVTLSYKLLLFGINSACAAISYFSFKAVLKSRYAALIASCLYTLASWRLCNIYLRGSLGTSLAMAFFPLILRGMAGILVARAGTTERKKAPFFCIIGFCCVIQAHLMSTFVACTACLICCVICVKKLIQPRRLLSLAASAGAVVLLNVWFIVPMLETLREGLSFAKVSAQTMLAGIADHALLPYQLFVPWGRIGGLSSPLSKGNEGDMPFGVGLSLVLAAAVFIVILAVDKGSIKRLDNKNGVVALAVAAVLMFMSTMWFPWEKLVSLGAIGVLVGNIQFSWRLLSAIALLLSLVGGIAALNLKSEKTRVGFALLLAVAMLAQSAVFYSGYSGDYGPTDTWGVECYGITSGEFLPNGCELENVPSLDRLYPEGESCEISDYSKEGTHITMRVKNASDEASALELPLLNYIGYKATGGGGEELELTKGDNGTLAVEIPPSYDGAVEINYVGRALWRVSEAISLLTLGGVVYWYYKEKKKPL